MPSHPEELHAARERIFQVFRYLKALNQHRNPAARRIEDQPWQMWFHDLPDHSSIAIRDTTQDASEHDASSRGEGEDAAPRYALRVRRPKITPAPLPPEGVAEWLQRGWDNPAAEPQVKSTRNESDDQGQTRVVGFDDDPERARAFEVWRRARSEWAKNELPVRKALKIFQITYELWGRIEREAGGLELLVGDGILSWHRPDGLIHHPILLQQVQLEFDLDVPEFKISETQHPVEFYTGLFQSLPDVDGRAIVRVPTHRERPFRIIVITHSDPA